MPNLSQTEWEEISQDIPKEDEAVIVNYLGGRSALIAEEKKQRSDDGFRQGLSPIARKACGVVSRIREAEKASVWASGMDGQQADVNVHPDMMLPLAKERMKQTRLWQIVRAMPKGALLHAHCDAMVDFDFLLAVVMATPGMHVMCADGSLASAAAREDAAVVIRFRTRTDGEASIWTEDYEPGTFVRLTKAADGFPDGGRAAFVDWLKSRCVLSRTDAIEQQHGMAEVWKRFMLCFDVVGSMLHYEPIWRTFLQKLMSLLVADGVSWVELRFAWPLDYCREGSDTPESDYDHMFQVIEEEVALFKGSKEGSNFWGLRMIWTSIRSQSTRSIMQDMDNCIATKLDWPHLIAGYDLAGVEDGGRPLVDLLPELFWFLKQCAAERVTIPFFFHAGGCLGDGDATDENLFDAVLLGTRRIGHAFSLYKHPRLIDAVKDRRILVESCPISNEVLRLTSSIMAHPLPALLARGVPCALSNPDPAILSQDTAGLTHDFWQALQGWENLGLAGLGAMAENSVRWAAFEDQEAEAWSRDLREASTGSGIKASRLQQWAVAWEKFCLWIVTTYADHDEGGDDDAAAAE